jgi:menaquinone-dependent protoporphyrinogen oxidase
VILVVYARKHGATEGIARFITERLTERGKQADARTAGTTGELGHPEAVVSAIYARVAVQQRSAGHTIFCGALGRGSLGFAERMMVKAVKAREGDFRDWDAIRAWTDRIVDELDAPAG